jgi:sigma-B regulation protein RsbU (phosphoserine phosphatase)
VTVGLLVFAFVGFCAMDIASPRDVTSTLLFGVVVWIAAFRFGVTAGLGLAILASLVHLASNLGQVDQPHSASLAIEEISEGLVLVLLAIQAKQFRGTLEKLKASRFQAVRLHNELKGHLENARRVQLALQGPVPQTVDSAQLASRNLVALELGGDFLLVRDEPNYTLLGVADVSGKGPQAALVAAVARGICQEITRQPLRPRDLLRRLEARLAGLLPDDIFVTAFFAVHYPRQEKLVYAAAGHEPAWLRRGQESLELMGQNLPLGPFAPQEFEESEVEFPGGSCLLVYSDGLVDAQLGDGRRLGTEPVVTTLEQFWDRPTELIYHLESMLPSQLSDDVTIIALASDRDDSLWQHLDFESAL